jgi:hypothetical protein
MVLVNGNMDETYYKGIIKNIGYIYDDLFNKDDVKMIINNTFYNAEEDDEVVHLTTLGHKSSGAPETDDTIWRKLGDQTVHSFAKIYSKLICCLGEKDSNGKKMSLTVPIYDPTKGEMTFQIKEFKIPTRAECSFGGQDFFDDGTAANYNPLCETLMLKYCLFLQKYDPENDLIKKMCGCLLPKKFLSKNVDWENPTNQIALMAIDSNRKCGISECLKGGFRREDDRATCASTVNICTNNLNVSEIEAESAAISNIKLSNNCGGAATPAVPTNNTSVPAEATDVETTNSGKGNDNDTSTITDTSTPTEDEASTPAKKPAKKSAKKPPAKKSAAVIEEEVGFFQSIINWFAGLFGSEGFSPKNDKFDFLYSIFSIIVLYMLVLKDPLRISKKINKMF